MVMLETFTAGLIWDNQNRGPHKGSHKNEPCCELCEEFNFMSSTDFTFAFPYVHQYSLNINIYILCWIQSTTFPQYFFTDFSSSISIWGNFYTRTGIFVMTSFRLSCCPNSICVSGVGTVQNDNAFHGINSQSVQHVFRQFGALGKLISNATDIIASLNACNGNIMVIWSI